MPPKGTIPRQKHLLRGGIQRSSSDMPRRQVLTADELKGLDKAIGEQFGWEQGPREHQMRAINAQLQGLDAIVHAGTGSGKTGIAAGPHVHPSSKGKVTLMVSPLIALHDEQVSNITWLHKKEAYIVFLTG